jgi:hypothetical protein
MWIIVWVVHWHFCNGKIKYDILTWKFNTIETFLNLEYATRLYYLQQGDQIKILHLYTFRKVEQLSQ